MLIDKLIKEPLPQNELSQEESILTEDLLNRIKNQDYNKEVYIIHCDDICKLLNIEASDTSYMYIHSLYEDLMTKICRFFTFSNQGRNREAASSAIVESATYKVDGDSIKVTVSNTFKKMII